MVVLFGFHHFVFKKRGLISGALLAYSGAWRPCAANPRKIRIGDSASFRSSIKMTGSARSCHFQPMFWQIFATLPARPRNATRTMSIATVGRQSALADRGSNRGSIQSAQNSFVPRWKMPSAPKLLPSAEELSSLNATNRQHFILAYGATLINCVT